MIASVAGNTNAAPTPIAPRQKMSMLLESANAANALMIPNNNKPICMLRLRPRRSPTPPPASSRQAKTNAYASTIHCNAVVDAFNSRCNVGRAMLMIKLSTTTRNTLALRTRSTHQRRS